MDKKHTRIDVFDMFNGHYKCTMAVTQVISFVTGQLADRLASARLLIYSDKTRYVQFFALISVVEVHKCCHQEIDISLS